MQDQVGRSLKAAVSEAMAEKEATFERLGEAREHAAELQVDPPLLPTQMFLLNTMRFALLHLPFIMHCRNSHLCGCIVSERNLRKRSKHVATTQIPVGKCYDVRQQLGHHCFVDFYCH